MEIRSKIALQLLWFFLASCSAYKEAGTREGHKYRTNHRKNVQASTLLYSPGDDQLPGRNPAPKDRFITTKLCEKVLAPASTKVLFGFTFKSEDEKETDKVLADHYKIRGVNELGGSTWTYKHETSFTPAHFWHEFIAPTSVTDQPGTIVYSEIATGPIKVGDSVEIKTLAGNVEPGYQRSKSVQSVGYKYGIFEDVASERITVKKRGEARAEAVGLAIRYDVTNLGADGTTVIGVRIFAPDGRKLPDPIPWLDIGKTAMTVRQSNSAITAGTAPSLLSNQSSSVKFTSGETLIIPLTNTSTTSECALVRLNGFRSKSGEDADFEVKRIVFKK